MAIYILLMSVSLVALHLICFPFSWLDGSETLKTIASSSLLLVMIFGVVTSMSDPGYLVQSNQDHSLLTLIKECDPVWICYECEICCSPRSRHCNVCNRCVDRFDHHCPWINNCIGQNNLWSFYVFITS